MKYHPYDKPITQFSEQVQRSHHHKFCIKCAKDKTSAGGRFVQGFFVCAGCCAKVAA